MRADMDPEREVDGRQGLGKSRRILMERLTERGCTSSECTIGARRLDRNTVELGILRREGDREDQGAHRLFF
jgi:hypothetical protein